MRRSPLTRTAPLTADPDKTLKWRVRAARKAAENAKPRTPLKRHRKGTVRSRVVPKDWTKRVFAMHGHKCVVTGGRAHHAHHVLGVNLLVREGHADKAGDPKNGLPLSSPTHFAHHSAMTRVPRSCLPASAIEFAREVGLLHVIDREYGEAT